MSKSLNKVQLIGRLGADPQMRYTTAGVPVTSFSVATNRQWNGKDGQPHEETDWHFVVAWDKLAQICSEHLTRGRLVYVEGRLQTRSWEQDGQTRYKTEIIASDLLILDQRGSAQPDVEPEPEMETVAQSAAPSRRSPASARGREAASPPAPSRQGRVALVEPPDDPDDLPF